MKVFAIGAAALLTGIYSMGGAYFGTHVLPGTTVAGMDISFMDKEEAAARAREYYESGQIVIYERDGQEVIELKDIEAKADMSGFEKELAEMDAYSWPARALEKRDLAACSGISFNEELLKKEFEDLDCVKNAREPRDASIELTDRGYEIIPEDDGKKIDEDKAYDLLFAAVSEGKGSVDYKPLYKKAAVHADDPSIKESMAKIDKYQHMSISLDMTGAEEVIDKSVICKWIDLDGEVSIDRDKVHSFVEELAYKYETFKTKRSFHTSEGEDISVGGGFDTYGFLMDNEATTDLLVELAEKGEDAKAEPVWRAKARTRGQGNGDIGSSYIEVSLSSQHLWFYQDGDLVLESDVVTGLPYGDRATPEGVYRIWHKERDATLTSQTYGYESHVSYWMPITWTGIGLHDASWRGSFGGSIYLSNGSHGCVNLPVDTARAIFEADTLDMPVIIHY